MERDKNKALQEELEKLRTSHHELSPRYETDALTLKQQVESLQPEHETENKSHADMVQLIDTVKAEKDTLQHEVETVKLIHAERAKQDIKLIGTLRTEKDALCQEMAEEIIRMQKEADHKAMLLSELEELRNQLNAEKLSRCECLITLRNSIKMNHVRTRSSSLVPSMIRNSQRMLWSLKRSSQR